MVLAAAEAPIALFAGSKYLRESRCTKVYIIDERQTELGETGEALSDAEIQQIANALLTGTASAFVRSLDMDEVFADGQQPTTITSRRKKADETGSGKPEVLFVMHG